MAEERQPPTVVEGATTSADLDDEVPPDTAAKSAEDRKAAAALSKLDDTRGDDDAALAARGDVDHDAVNRAMTNLGSGGGGDSATGKEARKVKVDAADVALLVDQLDLTKAKATELLKAHEGDAVKAMSAFVTAN